MKPKIGNIRQLFVLLLLLFLLLSLETACQRRHYKKKDEFKVTNGSVRISGVRFTVNYSNGEISGDFKDSFPMNTKGWKETVTRRYKIDGHFNTVDNKVKINIRGTWTSDNTSSGASTGKVYKYTVLWDVKSQINGRLRENENITGKETTFYRIKTPKSKFTYKYGVYYASPLASYDPKNFEGFTDTVEDWQAEPLK